MPARRGVASWLPERLCPWLAAALVLAAAALHLLYLGWRCPLDLAPDEAHYWDWSRRLDWSYYSKGPLVAWLIRLSCAVLGDWSQRHTGDLAFAVRLPAVVCGSLLLASLYVLTVQVFARPRLALAVVAAALTVPLVAAGSSLMTIDAPYTCCWGWALVFAHRAVTGRSAWAWEATGLAVGVGILAKYTMVLFLPSLVLFLLTTRDYRHWLRSGGFWAMLGITAFGCLPIAIWNAQHDWVTLRHVVRLAGLGGEAATLRPGGGLRWAGPLVFLGGQAALLLGYWFAAWLAVMLLHHPLRERDAGVRYLWWTSATVFAVFAAFSLKTNGGELNWPVTAYLSGGVLAGWWLAAQLQSSRAVLRLGTATAVGVCGLVGVAVTLAAHRSDLLHPWMERLAGPPTPTRPYPVRQLDPTCRLRGWRHLAAEVDRLRDELRAGGTDPVLAGVSWNVPGQLGVYCAGHPQAYNIGPAQGDRHSQYDLWANPFDQPELFLGRTFIVVGPLAERTQAAFERLGPEVEVTYRENGRPLAGWTVRVCHGFRGFGPRPAGAAH